MENTISTGGSRIANHVTILKRSNVAPRALVVLFPGTGAMDRSKGVFHLLPDALVDDTTAVLLIPSQHSNTVSAGLNLSLDEIADEDRHLITEAEEALKISDLKLTFVGLSEGALIAASIVGSHAFKVQALVAIGSPGLPGVEYSEEHLRRETMLLGLGQAEALEVEQYYDRCYRALLGPGSTRDRFNELSKIRQTTNLGWSSQEFNQQENMLASKWMMSFLQCQPSKLYKGVACPLLILYGAQDEEMNVTTNCACIQTATQSRPTVTTRVFDGLGHDLSSKDLKYPDSDVSAFITQWLRPHLLEVNE